MPNNDLKQLLNEYEQKRNKAISEAQDRKKEMYDKNPRLQEIDDELNNLSFRTARDVLKTSNTTLLEELKQKKQMLLSEKEEILSRLKIDNSYFNPHFECEKCQDTGYITNNYNTVMCNCLKQRLFDLKYNTYNTYDIRNHSFDSFSTSLYSDKIDKEKYHFNISPRDNMENIKKIAQKFINNFDNPDEKNLLFTGNTGLGKTFLSQCIANELLKRNKTVLYQTAPIMINSIIDYRMGKKTSFDLLNNILNVDLLVIDDLGTEGMNSMKFSELFSVLNSRLLNQKDHITKTIISTNLSLNNLAEMYGERIISRLVGSYNICVFFGDDIRRKKAIQSKQGGN